MILLYVIFIWHLNNTVVFNCLKDYDFWIIDIFKLFLLLLHRGGWRFFDLISCFSPSMGFRWRTVLADFRVNHPGECGNSPFAENRSTEKLDGKACVLCCFYLFIYPLVFVYLYISFLLTVRGLFIGSGINWWGTVSIKLCGDLLK